MPNLRKRPLGGEGSDSQPKKQKTSEEPAPEADGGAAEAAGENEAAAEAIGAGADDQAQATDNLYGLLTPVLDLLKCTVCKCPVDPVNHKVCPKYHFACLPKCVSSRKRLCPACKSRYKSKADNKLPIGVRKLLEERLKECARQSKGDSC